MSEVLSIRPIQESDFSSVLEIEQASYKFPCSREYLDCVAAGYHCRVLLKGEHVVGYCIGICGRGSSYFKHLRWAQI